MASDLDSYIDATAAILGLSIDPAWKEGVRTNLEITLGLANFVAAFELPDEAEPAPIYKA